MRFRRRRSLAMAVVVALAACTSGPEPPNAPAASAPVSSAPSTPASSDTDASPQDVWVLEPFTDLEPGTYFIDPDLDPSTAMRVTYEIPAEGWQQWIGAAKFSDAGHSGLSITTVSSLVTHGCRDHSWAASPVGPGVDDLAAALARLAPFRVTSAPQDVTAYEHSGTHLELTVPNRPDWDDGTFIGCTEWNLKSWVAAIDINEPGDAFYGYTGPAYTEEFWILDVDGTRLMIAAGRSTGSPSEDLEELRAILDSIRIEP